MRNTTRRILLPVAILILMVLSPEASSAQETKGFSLDLKSVQCDICFIKIMDDYKIKGMMDSLATCRDTNVCDNGFAVEVMQARLNLLREISHQHIARNTKENIRCMLQNLYRLTGIAPKGDGDYIGYTFISPHTISQYEEWFETNKNRLCIDMNTWLLFVHQK